MLADNRLTRIAPYNPQTGFDSLGKQCQMAWSKAASSSETGSSHISSQKPFVHIMCSISSIYSTVQQSRDLQISCQASMLSWLISLLAVLWDGSKYCSFRQVELKCRFPKEHELRFYIWNMRCMPSKGAKHLENLKPGAIGQGLIELHHFYVGSSD